jgi:hypothetical protein
VLPKEVIGGHALFGLGSLLGLFEEELFDLADSQAASQVIKGAVLLAGVTGAVGFAAGAKAFDKGSAEEFWGDAHFLQQTILSVTQEESGFAMERVDRSHN